MNNYPGYGLRVLYVLESFPHVTHSYIQTEIDAMRRFGVHVEVWSSRPPFSTCTTNVPVHNGSLQEAIESAGPHLLHTHWSRMVSRFRDVVAGYGLPVTVRGHQPYDVGPEFVDVLQSDPMVRSVYMYSRIAAKFPEAYTKIIPVDACFDPDLYFPESEKDPKLVFRAAPARTVKELDLFMRVARRCPAHQFVLVAGSTSELACTDQLRDYNRQLGEPVDLRIDVSRKDASVIMRKAGIYMYTVLPSEEYSMPISVSEALASGCYVLNRASDGARSHLGGAGALYHDEDHAVRLIEETLTWSREQWGDVNTMALACAEQLASPYVVRPILDDWLKIVESRNRNIVRKAQEAEASSPPVETDGKRLIVVLGMHRSGTSVITRGLQVMGVNLGETLVGAKKDVNDKGFWEDIHITLLDDEMLKAINSDWCHLSAIDSADIKSLRSQGYFHRAVDLLRQKVGSAPIFGFKDPRVAKLLPFWKEVFRYCQFDVSYVVALRHPLSVVKSLAKRDGFEREQSYLLWLGHLLTSLIGSAGNNQILVDYDCLMQSPDQELSRIAKRFNLEVDQAEQQRYVSEFLDEGLRHSVYDLSELSRDSACPQIVREVYTALVDVASEKTMLEDTHLQDQIARWSDEFERLRSPLLLADKLLVKIAHLNESLAGRDGQVARLNELLAERDGQIACLNESLAGRDGQIARLNESLAERDAELIALYSSSSWKITKPLRAVRRLMDAL